MRIYDIVVHLHTCWQQTIYGNASSVRCIDVYLGYSQANSLITINIISLQITFVKLNKKRNTTIQFGLNEKKNNLYLLLLLTQNRH